MKLEILAYSSRRGRADLLIIGHFEGDKVKRDLAQEEPELAKVVKKALDTKRFSGAASEVFSTFGGDAFQAGNEVCVVGLGSKKAYTDDKFRKIAGKITKTIEASKAKKVMLCLESFSGASLKADQVAGLLTEVALLASYRFDKYKKQASKAKAPAVNLSMFVGKKSTLNAGKKKVEAAKGIAEGVMLARTLVNEPANVMNAPRLAQEAKKMAAAKKLSCRIMEQAEMKRLGMGGILGVNQGSQQPPKLIILEHGKSHKSKGTYCLVGKGVTFDTGGLSIKPAKGMEKMKYDMGGAAAVIGAMSAIASLKLPMHVVALVPSVENNVNNDPQRPGDIIKMYNGKTVEVLNTDAEGRLILADALAYSEKFKPKVIMDMATLTGMCVYTFGDKAVAVMTNQEKLIPKVQKAGENAGEKCWPLPLWEEYGAQMKGHQSDLCNIGGPHGGTITAGKFLQEFVPENTPWLHFDIAGTAWSETGRHDCIKGATGVGVRLLTNLLANWKKS